MIADYDPARWMSQKLFPAKEAYTLKDVVIPGSHDAGMSVLTATGGKSPGPINECNVVTQTLSIEKQLNAGIRMFDLRVDQYNGQLFTKHAPSDCMEDAVAGGYGENLMTVLGAVKKFLQTNSQEFVILSFAHMCDKKLSLQNQAQSIATALGKDLVYTAAGKSIGDVPLRQLSGKVLITFEAGAFPLLGVQKNTMDSGAKGFLNYRRLYAATRDLSKMTAAQKQFFSGLSPKNNDVVRLDWQLTEASSEATFICNEFQSEKSNPLVDAAVLLANKVQGNKKILDLAHLANKSLEKNVNDWIKDGVINKASKPNILYVDASDTWITDVCVKLNESPLYTK